MEENFAAEFGAIQAELASSAVRSRTMPTIGNFFMPISACSWLIEQVKDDEESAA